MIDVKNASNNGMNCLNGSYPLTLTLIYYNMIEIEQWGKMIIWLWSRYIKKKTIPYIDLEFHYPMWMFYLVGGILGGLILGIALFYFTIIN